MAFDMVIPPWENRGTVIKFIDDGDDWKAAWPEIDFSIDPVQSAADYYILEALSSGYAFPLPVKLKPYRINTESDETFFKKFGVKYAKDKKKLLAMREKRIMERIDQDDTFELRVLMGEAATKLDELVDKLDVTFFHYGHMACAGELRHHPCIGSRVLPSRSRASAWVGWRKIHAELGSIALLDAAEIFYDWGKGRQSYGGAKWAVCSETVYNREIGKLGPDGPDGRINKRMFIDRMFTLEHNGGSFLNKIQWGTKNAKGWSVGYMTNLLNAHASNPTTWKTLLACASESVRDHFEKTLEATSKWMVANGMEALTMEDFTAKMYRVCMGCHSDPDKGHSLKCAYVHNGTVAGGDTEDFVMLNEFEWGVPYSWNVSAEQLAYDTAGVMNETFKQNAKVEIKVSMEVAWDDPDASFTRYTKHSTTKTAKSGEAEKLALDWSKFGKKKRELGWEMEAATATVTLYINGQRFNAQHHYWSKGHYDFTFDTPTNLADLFVGGYVKDLLDIGKQES